MNEPQPQPGHVVLPPGEPPRCDFCNERPVTWDYPCRNFQTKPGVPGFPIFNSLEGWAACDTCHALIESSNRKELTVRSVRKHPSVAFVGKRVLIGVIRRIHDDFWAHREGPAKPVVGERFDD